MNNVPIHLRNVPWPAEIFDHPQFIASLAKWYRPNIFVEYGICNGIATKVYAPYCKRVLGVDIKQHISSEELKTTIPNLTFFKMTTRQFKTCVLDNLNEEIDMAFIDADHNSEVAFQDFEDLFPKMIENGIIFIHDTFPCSSEWTKPIFCGDSWKLPQKIKDKYSSVCDVLTIPIQPGLTMVIKRTKPLDYMIN